MSNADKSDGAGLPAGAALPKEVQIVLAKMKKKVQFCETKYLGE